MATVHVAGLDPGPVVRIVVVAATTTRARQLERLVQDADFSVAGVARDPETAERLVLANTPSAVLVDLDLLDGGLEAIERIMASRPTPIVVCGDAADQPRAALAAGAVHVLDRLDLAFGTPEFAEALRRNLKMASRVAVITHPRARLRARHSERVERGKSPNPVPAAPPQTPPTPEPAQAGEALGPPRDLEAGDRGRTGRSSATSRAGADSTRGADSDDSADCADSAESAESADSAHGADSARSAGRPLVVAIGASTGGPPALAAILRELPVDLGVAVLVVQHMAEGFLEGLARWLDDSCTLGVAVARDGDRLTAGHVYLAPAGLNLSLRPGHRVELSPPPGGQYHVPGVDVAFTSVARLCGSNAVGVLLTGMGRDGAQGLLAMRQAGARTLSQDEATSVVWGMPAAALALAAVDEELPLSQIAAAIVQAVADCRDALAAGRAGS